MNFMTCSKAEIWIKPVLRKLILHLHFTKSLNRDNIIVSIVVNGEKCQHPDVALTLIRQCPISNFLELFSYTCTIMYSNFMFLDWLLLKKKLDWLFFVQKHIQMDRRTHTRTHARSRAHTHTHTHTHTLKRNYKYDAQWTKLRFSPFECEKQDYVKWPAFSWDVTEIRPWA